MAGGVVRSLITRILFKSDPTGLKKVETHAGEAKRAMRAASRAAWVLKRDLRQVGTGLRNWAIGAGVAVFSVNKLIDGFAKGADESAKFARGLGISLQAYQGLTHAAQLNGVSIAELNVALPKLAQNAGNAADGSKAAADAFRRAGVDVKDGITGKFKDPIRLMDELADSFKAGRFQGNKTQVLMNLFGRSGKKMGVLLSQGSEGIHKAMVEAKKLGIVMSASEAKVAEDYNDEMLRVKSTMAGLRNQIMVKLLPAIIANMKAFVAWAKEGDNLKRMVDGLIKGFKVLAVVLVTVAATKLGQTIYTLVQITKKAVFWTRLQGKATLLAYAPYIALAAAIAAVVLIVQSLYVWSKGGKSAVGDLFKHLGIADKARKVVELLGKAWRGFVAFLRSAGPVIYRVLQALVEGMTLLWDEFGEDLTALGKAIVDLFEELWPAVVTAAETAHKSMMILIRALGKAWREDIKPAITDIGKALEDLWITAKPIVNLLIEAQSTWLSWLWQAALIAIPYLGKIVRYTFEGISSAIKVGLTQLMLFVKVVTFIVAQLRTAFNLAAAVMGLQDAGEGAKKGANAAASVGSALLAKSNKGATNNNNMSIGTVSVAVSGTTDMTSSELQSSVAAGVEKGFKAEILAAFSGIKNAVPG